MDRFELTKYISETYNADIEFLWESLPNSGAFRHRENRKWFALIMDVRRDRLGLSGEDIVFIVNLKCDSLMQGSLCMEEGILPAYHMNKKQWISVLLDGTVPDEMIKQLVEMSFQLTDIKPKKRKQ